MTAWQITGTDMQWPVISKLKIKFPLHCHISFYVFLWDFSKFLDSFSLLSLWNDVSVIAYIIKSSSI